jgi:hypothetical protein
MAVSSVAIKRRPRLLHLRPADVSGRPERPGTTPHPAAHAISNQNPVSATNPNRAALLAAGQQQHAELGLPCPADKLVVTPLVGIPSGTTFTVTINYTGAPGVPRRRRWVDEGWFRSTPRCAQRRRLRTTEPVGTDSWMSLNNHPSAKPDLRLLRHDEHRQDGHRGRCARRLDPTRPTSVPNTYALSPHIG